LGYRKSEQLGGVVFVSRFITIVLLLCVVFFGGVFYGSFEQNRHPVEQVIDEEIEEVTIIESEQEEFEPKHMEEPIQFEQRNDCIHRTASFFEKIVSSLYELIIHVLY